MIVEAHSTPRKPRRSCNGDVDLSLEIDQQVLQRIDQTEWLGYVVRVLLRLARKKGAQVRRHEQAHRAEGQRATSVGPAEMRDLLVSVSAAIEGWSLRNGFPDVPPFFVLQQMMAMLEAQYDHQRRP